MKKAYSTVARFVRWVVASIISFIVAIPTYVSFSASL